MEGISFITLCLVVLIYFSTNRNQREIKGMLDKTILGGNEMKKDVQVFNDYVGELCNIYTYEIDFSGTNKRVEILECGNGWLKVKSKNKEIIYDLTDIKRVEVIDK